VIELYCSILFEKVRAKQLVAFFIFVHVSGACLAQKSDRGTKYLENGRLITSALKSGCSTQSYSFPQATDAEKVRHDS
jgi:hypothetical protein